MEFVRHLLQVTLYHWRRSNHACNVLNDRRARLHDNAIPAGREDACFYIGATEAVLTAAMYAERP